MKNLVLSFIILLLHNFCYSQEESKIEQSGYEYTIGLPYDDSECEVNYFHEYKDDILAVRRSKDDVIIQKFDGFEKNEKVINTYSAKDLFPENWLLEGVSFSGDFGYLFYSSWDGGDVRNEQLFYKRIALENGSFIEEEAKKILTVDDAISFSRPWGDGAVDVRYGGWNGADKFRLKENEETGNIAIRYTRKPKVRSNKKNFDVYGIKLLNSSYEEVYTQEYTMPYTETEMEVLDYLVSKDNSIKLLIKKYFDRSGDESIKGEINYDLAILQLMPDGTINTMEIDIPNFYVSDVKMKEYENGTISCVGYYSFGGKKAQTNGVFIFKINAAGAIIVGNAHEIPLELINKYTSKGDARSNERKAEKNKNTDLSLLNLRNVHFASDGSITIIGEGSVEKVSTKSYYHWYTDVYIIKLSTLGEVAWMQKIPKQQKGGNPNTPLGFQYFFKNNKYYIAYLDNFRNFNLSEDETPDTHLLGHGGFLFVTAIDYASGEKTTKKVFDVRDTKAYTEFIKMEYGNFFTFKDKLHFETNIPKKKNVIVSLEI